MKPFKALFVSLFLFPFLTTGLTAATAPAADEPPAVAVLADRNGNGISDTVESRLDTMAVDEAVDVIVTFKVPGVGAAAALRIAGPFPVHLEFSIVPGFAARMTAAQIRALANLPQVLRIEEDITVQASDINALRDFQVDRVQAAVADGGLGFTGSDIGVCIVDTGIHGIHEQFVNDTGMSRVVGFVDYVNGRTDPYDDNGHGSHVSNIAAGDGTGYPANEAALFIGVAPAADLYGAKVLDASGSGRMRNVIRGVEWCAAQPGVRVINLSLGSDASSDGTDSLSTAVNNAVDVHGKVVVVAAGNAGATPRSIGTPGAASRAITVAAVADWSASVERKDWWSAGPYLTPFSSRGPTADGRTKPDVAAPGHTIGAAYIDPYGGLLCTTDCYAVLSGTSMASPLVAGLAALMAEAGGETLSPDDVRQIIFETSHPRGWITGKDNEWGFRLIDPWGAVNRARGETLPTYTPAAFPSYRHNGGSVPDHGLYRVDLEVINTSQPMAVTVTIDGQLVKSGRISAWQPDLEARLRKPDGTDATRWLFLDSSVSQCPAIGMECGRYGRQETLFLAPPLLPAYRLEVWPAEDAFNGGRGGNFVFEIANARVAGTTDPAPGELAAAAGPDIAVTDSDGDGFANVELDGSASGPFGTIVSHVWSWTDGNGGHVATGIAPVVSLPIGTHEVWLTVMDPSGAATDVLSVTVTGGGGGGKPPHAGGGGKGKGKGKGKGS
jgi:serine protease AprX